MKKYLIFICSVCAMLFCAYKLITAECSYFNYVYLLGLLFIPLICGDTIIKIFKK